MPVGRISGHRSVLIGFGLYSWNYSRRTVAFAAARPQDLRRGSFVLVLISRVANSRSSSPVSSCGFSKLPRFLSDTAKIHGPLVSPRFPRVAPRNSSVQQSVRQYLIEGSELFAVHRYP